LYALIIGRATKSGPRFTVQREKWEYPTEKW